MHPSVVAEDIDPVKAKILTSVRAIFSPDGSAYKGTWYNSLRHGQGTHVYPNGDCYIGEWAFNLPQGYGEFYTNTDLKISRSMKKVIPDDPASCPTLTLTYAGYWDRGERHNFGKYYYNPNERYEGMWYQGLRSGFGCNFYPETLNPDNLLLSREEHAKQLEKLVNNTLAQKHIIVHSDLFRSSAPKNVTRPLKYNKITVRSSKFPFGCIYKGMWNADRRHGLGRIIFPNGDVFIGNFKSDHAYGIGVRYSANNRTVMQGFYDEHGRCVCSQVRSGFTTEDLKVVLAVWSEPCAPYVGITETVRRLIRTALCQDEEFFKLYSAAGGSMNTALLAFSRPDAQPIEPYYEDTPLDNTIGVPIDNRKSGEQMGIDSVIFHQGKAFSPQRKILGFSQYREVLSSPARAPIYPGDSKLQNDENKDVRTELTGQSFESGLYTEILQRASSKLSEKIGAEYDALESAFTEKISESTVPITRVDMGTDSALSNYSAQEYPYLFRPDDSEFDLEQIKENMNNLLKMAQKLPMGCAPDRTEIDKLLDLPLESDFKYFPESKLINGDLVILETLRSLVNIE